MKVPKAKKLPSGNYNIRLRLGGQEISITKPTETSCTRAAELIKAQYRSGKRIDAQNKTSPTVGKLIDDYIDSRREVLSPSTIAGYMVVRNNRFPDLMKMNYGNVKDWQKVINDEVSKKKTGKTIRNAWSLVSASIAHAGFPVPSVALPPVVKSERPWLDADQIKTFVAAMNGNEYEIPALLALHSLRRSEIFGLTWEKIDLQSNRIRIEGSIVQDENSKQVYKKTNKTKNSRRTIPIMIPRLKELLNAVPKENRKGPLYTAPQNYLWAEINRVCQENNLPEVGVHGLRHSFASLAHHVGLPEQEAMLIGGWEDAGTMHKIYEHISAADKLKAENKISQFFSGN